MSLPLPPLRVLVVDDNRTNLHILQVFLKKLGHEVMLAENGQEAVDKFHAEHPDLVLLDIMMPVMDGFEAARRIKVAAAERWVPIIFLSALNRDENLVEGLEAGGDDYLTKPINFVVLEAKMRSMQRSLMLQQRSVDALNRVQTISDSVLDAIVTIDASATIIACNSSTELLFGWTRDELIGRNVSVLIPEPHRSEHDVYVQNYVHGGPPHVIGSRREVEAVRKNGEIFPVDLGISEVKVDGSRLFIGVMRDITEQKLVATRLHENAEQLRAYYEHTQNEQQLAQRLMEKQLHRKGLEDERLQYSVLAAENFSGDVVAATRSSEGRFYALLGDATGHGLAAAISALPILAIFYRMAGLNSPLKELILELNQQLRESMPIGRFVATTVVCLDETGRGGDIWIGGTPPVYLIDRWGRPAQEFTSTHLPLGILGNAEMDAQPVHFTWEAESQLILGSDGLYEADNAAGQQFGSAGLLGAVAHTSPAERFDVILAALQNHLGDNRAVDDVSLMLISCP